MQIVRVLGDGSERPATPDLDVQREFQEAADAYNARRVIPINDKKFTGSYLRLSNNGTEYTLVADHRVVRIKIDGSFQETLGRTTKIEGNVFSSIRTDLMATARSKKEAEEFPWQLYHAETEIRNLGYGDILRLSEEAFDSQTPLADFFQQRQERQEQLQFADQIMQRVFGAFAGEIIDRALKSTKRV
jgi:hypothetical protein